MTDLVDEEFLTVAEVAGKLKLNQQTVRNWIDAGRLPAVRIGRRVRVTRSDYERLLASSYHPQDERGPVYDASAFWGGEPDPARDGAL